MYLKELSHFNIKKLYLELAVLLSQVDDEFLPTNRLLNAMDSESNAFFQAYSQNDNIDTLPTFNLWKALARDELLEKFSHYFNGCIDDLKLALLETVINESVYYYQSADIFGVAEKKYSRVDLVEDLAALIANINHTAVVVLSNIFTRYGNDPVLKNEIIQKILASGADLFSINENMLSLYLFSYEKVRFEILTATAKQCIDNALAGLQKDNAPFTLKDKKYLLLELIMFAYGTGDLSENQRQFLEHICDDLSIEKAQIDEFKDVAKNLGSAIKATVTNHIN